MVRRRSRRIDPDVYNEIHRRVREGQFTNAAELYRELLGQFPDKAPSERTVRDIVKELLPPESSGEWQPGPDVDPVDAATILDATATFLKRGGRSWYMTNDHAKWLVWIRRGWPDLDPFVAVVISADYLTRRESGKSTTDLDGFLAFAPWRGVAVHYEYQEAVKEGKIPEPPLWYRTSAMISSIQQAIESEKQQRKVTMALLGEESNDTP